MYDARGEFSGGDFALVWASLPEHWIAFVEKKERSASELADHLAVSVAEDERSRLVERATIGWSLVGLRSSTHLTVPRKGVLPLIDFNLLVSSVDFATTAFTVFAYLDPGTGSYAIQILLATLFGGLFALKQSWSTAKVWLASTFGERRGRDSTENTRPGIHAQPTVEIH